MPSETEICPNCDHGTDPRTLTTCNLCEGTGRETCDRCNTMASCKITGYECNVTGRAP